LDCLWASSGFNRWTDASPASLNFSRPREKYAQSADLAVYVYSHRVSALAESIPRTAKVLLRFSFHFLGSVPRRGKRPQPRVSTWSCWNQSGLSVFGWLKLTDTKLLLPTRRHSLRLTTLSTSERFIELYSFPSFNLLKAQCRTEGVLLLLQRFQRRLRLGVEHFKPQRLRGNREC